MKWKHFPRYWPFVLGNPRSPVNSPHKGQWRGALIFPLVRLNKRLGKQSRRRWFETPSHSVWRHYNVAIIPFTEPKLIYCQLDATMQKSVKFWSKYNDFHSINCVHKCPNVNVICKMVAIFSSPKLSKHISHIASTHLKSDRWTESPWWDVAPRASLIIFM